MTMLRQQHIGDFPYLRKTVVRNHRKILSVARTGGVSVMVCTSTIDLNPLYLLIYT